MKHFNYELCNTLQTLKNIVCILQWRDEIFHFWLFIFNIMSIGSHRNQCCYHLWVTIWIEFFFSFKKPQIGWEKGKNSKNFRMSCITLWTLFMTSGIKHTHFDVLRTFWTANVGASAFSHHCVSFFANEKGITTTPRKKTTFTNTIAQLIRLICHWTLTIELWTKSWTHWIDFVFLATFVDEQLFFNFPKRDRNKEGIFFIPLYRLIIFKMLSKQHAGVLVTN